MIRHPMGLILAASVAATAVYPKPHEMAAIAPFHGCPNYLRTYGFSRHTGIAAARRAAKKRRHLRARAPK